MSTSELSFFSFFKNLMPVTTIAHLGRIGPVYANLHRRIREAVLPLIEEERDMRGAAAAKRLWALTLTEIDQLVRERDVQGLRDYLNYIESAVEEIEADRQAGIVRRPPISDDFVEAVWTDRVRRSLAKAKEEKRKWIAEQETKLRNKKSPKRKLRDL